MSLNLEKSNEYFHIIKADEDISNDIKNLKQNNYNVFRIDAKKCTNTESFIKNINEVLEVPKYYGDTIHDFEEYINDLFWIENKVGMVFIFDNISYILKEETSKTIEKFKDIIINAVKAWNNGRENVNDLFSTEPTKCYLILIDENVDEIKKDFERRY